MLDAAWGDFTPDGRWDWARYTGSARPSADWVNACLAAGSVVTFIQEAYSTRSSEGYDVGVADCTYAEKRAREVHPGVRSLAVCASDGSYTDVWDASEYGRGWSDTATLPFFPYGAHGVIDSFVAGAQKGRGARLLVVGNDGQPGRWVPETWGPTNLLGQVVGPSPVPDTDLNHVHADYTGVPPAPIPPPPPEEDDVLYSSTDDGVTTYYVKAKGLVKLNDEEAKCFGPAVVNGKLEVIHLGGGLGALAFDTKLREDFAK